MAQHRQQQQQQQQLTALSIMYLCWKQPQQKLYCLHEWVCLCVISLCVWVCLLYHRYNQSAIVCVDERSNGAPIMYAISTFYQQPPQPLPFPLPLQCTPTKQPPIDCALFFMTKRASRNHNDKNHASQHRDLLTATFRMKKKTRNNFCSAKKEGKELFSYND